MTRIALSMALLLSLTGCAPAGLPAAGGLPGCGTPPSPAPDTPPSGAVLPPETRVTAVREEEETTQLNAYVSATPDQIETFVRSVEGLSVVAAETTGDERELLVTSDGWQIYLRASAVCVDGSLLLEVIAPAGVDVRLPQPGAAASSGPS